jgi:hypothetical protein
MEAQKNPNSESNPEQKEQWQCWRYHTTTVLKSICAFKSFSVCLMKLGALTLGAYSLKIVISF